MRYASFDCARRSPNAVTMNSITQQLKSIRQQSKTAAPIVNGSVSRQVKKTFRKHKSRQSSASFLYSADNAQSISDAQLRENALTALLELSNTQDRLLEMFEDTLLGESSLDMDRTLLSSDAQQLLANDLKQLLGRLAPHFLEESTPHILEYLVRKYQVHLYDPTVLIQSTLPFFESPPFAKLAALIIAGTDTALSMLLQATTSRKALASMCFTHPAVLQLVIDASLPDVESRSSLKVCSSLLLTVIVELLTMHSPSDTLLRTLLPVSVRCIKACVHRDVHDLGIVLVTLLCSSSSFSAKVTDSLISVVASTSTCHPSPNELVCVLSLVRSQNASFVISKDSLDLLDSSKFMEACTTVTGSIDTLPLLHGLIVSAQKYGITELIAKAVEYSSVYSPLFTTLENLGLVTRPPTNDVKPDLLEFVNTALSSGVTLRTEDLLSLSEEALESLLKSELSMDQRLCISKALFTVSKDTAVLHSAILTIPTPLTEGDKQLWFALVTCSCPIESLSVFLKHSFPDASSVMSMCLSSWMADVWNDNEVALTRSIHVFNSFLHESDVDVEEAAQGIISLLGSQSAQVRKCALQLTKALPESQSMDELEHIQWLMAQINNQRLEFSNDKDHVYHFMRECSTLDTDLMLAMLDVFLLTHPRVVLSLPFHKNEECVAILTEGLTQHTDEDDNNYESRVLIFNNLCATRDPELQSVLRSLVASMFEDKSCGKLLLEELAPSNWSALSSVGFYTHAIACDITSSDVIETRKVSFAEWKCTGEEIVELIDAIQESTVTGVLLELLLSKDLAFITNADVIIPRLCKLALSTDQFMIQTVKLLFTMIQYRNLHTARRLLPPCGLDEVLVKSFQFPNVKLWSLLLVGEVMDVCAPVLQMIELAMPVLREVISTLGNSMRDLSIFQQVVTHWFSYANRVQLTDVVEDIVSNLLSSKGSNTIRAVLLLDNTLDHTYRQEILRVCLSGSHFDVSHRLISEATTLVQEIDILAALIPSTVSPKRSRNSHSAFEFVGAHITLDSFVERLVQSPDESHESKLASLLIKGLASPQGTVLVTSLLGVLSGSMFLHCLSPILKTDNDSSIKITALRVLLQKLYYETFEDSDLKALIAPLLPCLDLVAHSPETTQLSLVCLELIYSSTDEDSSLPDALVWSAVAPLQNSSDTNVSVSAVLCAGSMASHMGPRFVAHLHETVLFWIDIASSSNSSSMITRAALMTIFALVDTLPMFLSPYLTPLVSFLLESKAKGNMDNDLIDTMLRCLVSELTAETLLSPTLAANDSMPGHAKVTLYHFVGVLCQEMSERHIRANYSILLDLFISGLGAGYDNVVTESLVQLILKMTEKELKSVTLSLIEWTGSETSRVDILFAIAHRFTEVLTVIFIPFYYYLMDLGIANITRLSVLRAFKLCATLDDTQVFVNDSIFSQLSAPLIDTIERSKLSVPCLISLFASVNDENSWSEATILLLRKLQSPNPRIQIAALSALKGLFVQLREPYLTLIPEIIPKVAETMESAHDQVAQLSRSVIVEIEHLSGESIQHHIK